MTRIHHMFLCAAVIILMITAGCTFMNNSGARPLVPDTTAPAATTVPSAPVPAGTTQPAAAGTQPPGTCAADVSSDTANCGGCGYTCPANALCQQGQCYCKNGYSAVGNQCVVSPVATDTNNGCPAGMSPCSDGYCYELASSASNCGTCGNVCPTGMICSASTCSNVPTEVTTIPTTATSTGVTTSTTTSSVGTGLTLVGSGVSKFCLIQGLTNCGGTCVNLTTSADNCGACGTKCTGPLLGCCKGTCMSFVSDASNCGSCGHVCGVSSTCTSGSCKIKTVVTSVTLGSVTVKLTTIPQYVNPIKYQIPGY